MRINDLRPHPRQIEIYGSEPVDADLVKSIVENGILQPIIVTDGNVILSGYRRWRAADHAGLKEVPIDFRKGMSAVEQLALLIEANRQRVKTHRQMAQEAVVIEEIEKERARLRQAATRNSNAGKAVVANLPPQVMESKGKVREKVAEHLNVSPRTADKLITVGKQIDLLEKTGKREEAERIEKTLNERSVDAAYRQVRPPATDAKKPAPPRAPRPSPEVPKGRQVSQQELRRVIRDAGGAALTSTSNVTDRNADTIIWEQIKASNPRTVWQAIGILIEEWPADGVSFFINTVKSLKQKNGGNSNGKISGAAPQPDKYASRR